jgi:hypothetical protein
MFGNVAKAAICRLSLLVLSVYDSRVTKDDRLSGLPGNGKPGKWGTGVHQSFCTKKNGWGTNGTIMRLHFDVV